jgi:hypothetical protein
MCARVFPEKRELPSSELPKTKILPEGINCTLSNGMGKKSDPHVYFHLLGEKAVTLNVIVTRIPHVRSVQPTLSSVRRTNELSQKAEKPWGNAFLDNIYTPEYESSKVLICTPWSHCSSVNNINGDQEYPVNFTSSHTDQGASRNTLILSL